MDRRPYLLGISAVVGSGALWAVISALFDLPSTVATLVGMVVGGLSFLLAFDLGAQWWWY